MKVIIVGTAYPYRGGLAAFNERLATEYRRQGYEVKIYTFRLQYPAFLFPGKTQYSTGSQPPVLDITRRINSVNPFNWLKTGRMIKKEKADLLIFAYWMAFMAPCFGTIAKLSRTKGVKRIGLIHNMIPHEPNLLDKIFPKYFIKQMDAFIALSGSVAEDIAKFDRQDKPKAVSPHPLYDHFGEKISRKEALAFLNLDDNVRYMLFFGFIRDYKGLDLLLKAFADEGLRKLNVKLIVAGEFYNNSKRYFDLENELNLSGRVLWYSDFIPDSEVKYFFNAADIVVQPYKSATQSGVTQIAYHFEKPMLVTNVGGLSEIVPNGKAGYAVDPDEKEIAAKLTGFFENKRFDDFQQGILEEKQKYGWDILVKAIDNITKSIP
ncbi:MAG: glycosyltransferase [Prevotellaceae bacterium]|jgi:glycosyltransferase involved in cell wall biosynthesis|nr:glycosyltransferase [Prevotellaceae bacterium]